MNIAIIRDNAKCIEHLRAAGAEEPEPEPSSSEEEEEEDHDAADPRFVCDKDCGYEGSFDDVAAHEKICNFASKH